MQMMQGEERQQNPNQGLDGKGKVLLCLGGRWEMLTANMLKPQSQLGKYSLLFELGSLHHCGSLRHGSGIQHNDSRHIRRNEVHHNPF